MALPQYEPKPVNPIEEEKDKISKLVANIPLRIGVHSGKGGVGKTFLSTQLSMYLANQGNRVGLIDADIDCPNIPKSLGLSGGLDMNAQNQLIPRDYNNVKVISTGLMQDEDEALIIRGPIKHKILTDFIEKTAWGPLDALIFDFPPGTSDVPLSAMQVANLTGIVIVTTPTETAQQDAARAIQMAKKLGVNVYGIIENMSGEVFGKDTTKELAEKYQIKYFGSIPLSSIIRKESSQGKLVISEFLEQIDFN